MLLVISFVAFFKMDGTIKCLHIANSLIALVLKLYASAIDNNVVRPLSWEPSSRIFSNLKNSYLPLNMMFYIESKSNEQSYSFFLYIFITVSGL